MCFYVMCLVLLLLVYEFVTFYTYLSQSDTLAVSADAYERVRSLATNAYDDVARARQ